MPIDNDSVSLLDWGSQCFSKKEREACCFFLSRWNTLQLQSRHLKPPEPTIPFDIVAYAYTDIDDFTDIKFVCLLNCSQTRWCMIETSSSLPRKSSAIFGHHRKCTENVRQRWCALGTSFWESSEIFGKVVGNLRKIVKNAVISVSCYNKKNITR